MSLFQKFRSTGFFRLIKNKFFLLSVGFVVWVLFFDPKNLTDWYRVHRNVVEQERQIKYYSKEILTIDKKFNELNSNLDSLEKFAREQYYFKRGDEEIFVIAPSVPKPR